MAKRKRTSRKPAKDTGPKHSVPSGFWRQVGALLLIVFALLLAVALFGTGGPALNWGLGIAQALIGWAVYALPFILIFLAIEIFKAENNKLPFVMRFATVLFIAWIAGFLQLFTADPTNSALATDGQGGGLVGWFVAQMVLSMTGIQMAGLVLAVLGLITSLFVFRITPKALIDTVRDMFQTDTAISDNNKKVAASVAKGSAAEPATSGSIGELKLNHGVDTVGAATAAEPTPTEKPKPSRFSSFKNSAERKPETHTDDVQALTTRTDTDWEAPSIDLLEKKQSPADAGDVKHNAQVIKDTLAEFNIQVEMEGANIGPKVTQYTLKPPSGVKLTRITALETNIALNLAAQALRIEAPIPGQRAVGIEVPNRKAADVRLHGILSSKNWKNANAALPFAIGKDISGDAVVGELEKMPHMLIAGQTGSGKSVMINTLLCSLLYKNSPSNMKLILVDPKQVEMAPYRDIPHLLTPVITEPEKCISALKWAVNEMERRYSLLADQNIRNIKSYNEINKDSEMPYIVIVIDELADLMMMAARDVEALIVRIAQKARAVGIHLVLATQRPSVDVITGLIKANVPARIAFTVASQVDSRTILDQVGAEKLLGQGDMLMTTPAMSKPKRIQGAFLSDEEVSKIAEHLKMQSPPDYDDEIVAQPVQINGKGGVVMDHDGGDDDAMYKDAVRVVVESGKASASLLQRRLRVGYGRAARLIESMEEQGIIGPADGARPRDVLISSPEEAFAARSEA